MTACSGRGRARSDHGVRGAVRAWRDARGGGHTKVLNLMSNIGALALFIPAGDVLWPAAIAMAIGQSAPTSARGPASGSARS